MSTEEKESLEQLKEQIDQKVDEFAQSSSDDDDYDDDDDNQNENGKKNKKDDVAVENFRFAADDRTQEVPYPQKHLIILPKHLLKLVDEAQKNSSSSSESSTNAFLTAANSPLRIFKAPHPRHGEQVLFLAASYWGKSNDNVNSSDEQNSFLEFNGTNENENNENNTSSNVRLVRIYELQARKPHHSTWFIGDSVEPQSPLLIASPLHPAFFALRLAVADAVSCVGGRDAFENAMMEFIPRQEQSTDEQNSSSSSSLTNRFRLRASDDWTMSANQMLLLDGAADKNFASTTPFANLWDGYLKQGFQAVCEEVKRGNDNDSGSSSSSSCFYRFCPQKATDFLQTRLQRITRSRSFDHLVFGSSSSSASQNQQPQQDAASSSSEKSKSVLEERAVGLILEYVTKDLPHHHARRWILGSQRATAVMNKKIIPSAFSKEDAAVRAGLNEDGTIDEMFGGADAMKRKKAEEDKKNSLKSSNVKKLEKAGAPKGTKSVASFFAVKKK